MSHQQARSSKSGELLRSVRQLLGLTLAALAAEAGIHPATLSRVENGRRALTLPMAARLLRALDKR